MMVAGTGHSTFVLRTLLFALGSLEEVGETWKNSGRYLDALANGL